MNKKIAVLGATGSVGLQALDVAKIRGYEIDFMSANNNTSMMEEVCRRFSPKYAAMADYKSAKDLKTRLADTSVKVLFGEEGICEGISLSSSQTVVNSIIGKAGLIPTLAVIKSGKRLALANKESLVIAGSIVMACANKSGVEILPVDSEHSAIFQSLKSGRKEEIKRLLLTASGGPFYGKSREELKHVTISDTLNHPTWKMGKKITVDSATLMNKGFEVIEAAHLFSVDAKKIEILVHRESILHSAIEYIDNAVIGEFSVPDMRMCIQYAVDYPKREISNSDELDLVKIGSLTFNKPDYQAFPLLDLAKKSIEIGGAMPAVLNAADEVAVAEFLAERISFVEISEVVAKTFDKLSYAKDINTLEGILAIDKEAREVALNTAKNF